MVTTIALDIGNANTKVIASGAGVIASDNKTPIRLSYSSQVKQITLDEYRNIEARKNVDMSDYFIVNGIPYVTGDSANKTLTESFLKATGSNRYNENIIGVAAAIAMRRVIKRDVKPNVIASFPPAHSQYASDLCTAIDRNWRVENQGVTYEIDVRDIFAIDEPLATYYNVLLTQKGDYGRSKRARDLQSSVVLVVDGGGYTLDTASIDRNADVDYSNLRSFEGVAAQSILYDFSRQINQQHKNVMRGSRVDLWRYIEALKTGRFAAGIYGVLDVSTEAHEHRAILFNQYLNAIDVANGGANFDEILFTGGASGLIRSELEHHFGLANVTFASDDDNIHLANADGLHSFLKFAIANGV